MCTKDRRAMLARDEVTKILSEEWRAAHERHSWAVGRYVIMPDHVHFFCRPELGAPRLSEFIGAWKSWTSRKIHALVGHGQRPRLQHCGNASSLITFFAPMKVMISNGITFSIIRFAREWKYAERLKRVCCSGLADGGKFVIRFRPLSLTSTYQARDACLAVSLSPSFRSLGPGPSLRHLG